MFGKLETHDSVCVAVVQITTAHDNQWYRSASKAGQGVSGFEGNLAGATFLLIPSNPIW